jgi:hypothetical protein
MSKRNKQQRRAMKTVQLTPQEACEFMRTVHDDLAYLQRQDYSAPSRTDVRLASSVLRRLLHEGLLSGAWQAAGLAGQPRVTAIDLDAVLGDTPRRYIHYAYAGGARTSGAHHKGYALMVVPKHEHEAEGADHVMARIQSSMKAGATRAFPLADFCRSPCLVSGDAAVNRLELVRYVANKLGGVHWDNQRQAWAHPTGSRHRLLDEQHLYVGKLSAPLYELVSIAQSVAEATDTTLLMDAIDRVMPEETRNPDTLSFREGRIGRYADMNFASRIAAGTDDKNKPSV